MTQHMSEAQSLIAGVINYLTLLALAGKMCMVSSDHVCGRTVRWYNHPILEKFHSSKYNWFTFNNSKIG